MWTDGPGGKYNDALTRYSYFDNSSKQFLYEEEIDKANQCGVRSESSICYGFLQQRYWMIYPGDFLKSGCPSTYGDIHPLTNTKMNHIPASSKMSSKDKIRQDFYTIVHDNFVAELSVTPQAFNPFNIFSLHQYSSLKESYRGEY